MKRLVRIAKRVATGLAALLSLVFVGLQAYKVHLNNSTRIETPNGISSLEEITLGGLKQWIFIRDTDQNNPVLLFGSSMKSVQERPDRFQKPVRSAHFQEMSLAFCNHNMQTT